MKILLFLGSTRQSAPPKPARLGQRVALFCEKALVKRAHDVEIIDPLNIEFGEVFKPHFSYSSKQVPAQLEVIAEQITGADAYVMISPEYNHSMSPALAHLLNHFGSSRFSYKPSAIVTYSAGQWGGTRAAISMRAFLSELGCLPVSAMLPIPKAQTLFDEKGDFLADADGESWHAYADRVWLQLEWWATAAQQQRSRTTSTKPTAFQNNPNERDAPTG